MTPPAMDEQQAMQMKMMKYMMIIFGLMFYKVAAGLCIYFIASSLWGFAERKLLPKKKPAPGALASAEEPSGLLQRLRHKVQGLWPWQTDAAAASGNGAPASGSSEAVSSAIPTDGTSRKRTKRRRRGGPGRADAAASPEETSPDGVTGKVRSWWGGLREWWAHVLRQAEKK